MLFHLKNDDRLDRLDEQLRRARSLTPGLMTAVVTKACVRLPALKRVGKVAWIDRLIEISAWTEAALALIEIELPEWKVRQLCHEDGEWHCRLSCQPNLPAGLDETAEGSHEDLPLALLCALIDAWRIKAAPRAIDASNAPVFQPQPDCASCCDNFA